MKNLKDRIISRSIKTESGCWEWQGTTKGFGYGSMTIGSRKDGTRKTEASHRVSYMAFNGEIIGDMWVLHTCDNPSCVNPKHLYLGDRKQNTKDMMDRGRLNHVIGENVGNSILSKNDVLSIRKERLAKGTPYRTLAKKYNLKSHKSVIEICNKKLWAHL